LPVATAFVDYRAGAWLRAWARIVPVVISNIIPLIVVLRLGRVGVALVQGRNVVLVNLIVKVVIPRVAPFRYRFGVLLSLPALCFCLLQKAFSISFLLPNSAVFELILPNQRPGRFAVDPTVLAELANPYLVLPWRIMPVSLFLHLLTVTSSVLKLPFQSSTILSPRSLPRRLPGRVLCWRGRIARRTVSWGL
jgi:hypothetical protein